LQPQIQVRDNYSRGAASSAHECRFDRRRSSRVNLAPELKQSAAAGATRRQPCRWRSGKNHRTVV